MLDFEFAIPCPHEVTDKNLGNQRIPIEERAEKHARMPQLPDYHPLTKEEVATLLDKAVKAEREGGDIGIVFAVQGRLRQGVIGMICPRPTYGEVHDKWRQVEALYREVIKNGNNPAVVGQIYKIMTG